MAGSLRLLVAVAEQEELQLRGHHRPHPHRLQAGDLLLQDRARGMRHLGMAVVVEHVAQHQRGAVEPRNPPQGGEVRLHRVVRSEEHTSELQSLMRISYAVFCLKKKTIINKKTSNK